MAPVRTTRHRATSAVGTVLASVLALSALSACTAGDDSPPPIDTPMTVTLVDPDATTQTRSLFGYLDDVRGTGILFGHQHATTYGVSIGEGDGTTSDVKNGVGDHPALFGWDTLSLYGHERPGDTEASVADNTKALAKVIEQAYAAGGIITISTHPWNFVSGNDFYDATAGVVTAILPGGEKNADFNAYLDDVAALAGAVKDTKGDPLPLIIRPFHENNGSWFWWGAAQCTSGEYIELYRYTVEYLRDVKGVHNLLYAYSPNGSFGGDPDSYLTTYPGDDYVDILGYDRYDDTSGSQEWLDATVQDLAMIAKMADERGKVSAFTEFGVSGALKPNGENENLTWFTDLLAAIKADPDASRSAYMQTWANFDTEQYFVPYPATGDLPEHELLADFRAYADDSYTLFASDVTGAWNRVGIDTSAHDAAARVVSPAGGQRVLTPETTVRARVSDAEPTRVYFTTDVDGAEHDLAPADSGYYEATWAVGAENLTNRTATITLVAETPAGDLTSEQVVLLGAKPELPAGFVDDFEGYADDVSLRDEYTTYQVNTISLVHDPVGSGKNAMRFDYDFATQDYTGVGRSFEADWTGYDRVRLWYQPDGSNHRLVLQLAANGGYWEVYPSMAGTEAGSAEFTWDQFVVPSWNSDNNGRVITPEDLAAVTQLNVYINQEDAGTTTSGSFVIDDLQAANGA